ncbi:transglutaminase family protein [Emcibacter sp. SYSU 3D8]|uniref:transglutaminase-like domain-containing protein n=1 Tax=Emcibacter sp. SYSU 3D8 TaxID=3133969 RepID=UPI0031FF3304
MQLRVRAELVYGFQAATQVRASIEAALSADQTVISESLTAGGDQPLVRDFDEATGQRQFRTSLSGEAAIIYEAVVDNGERAPLPHGAREHLWSELPLDCLPYLLPSRFCPSDKFMRFAQREFSGLSDGGAKVHAVLDWLHEHVDYVAGVSTAETTAERTFVDRAGVCRDFTHLGITLCRSLNIPARAVSAYAWKLAPPDFHAIFEVYLGGQWWLVDPTRLSPVEGIVRIACGRDAADIAFMTTSQNCDCRKVAISVELAQP